MSETVTQPVEQTSLEILVDHLCEEADTFSHDALQVILNTIIQK